MVLTPGAARPWRLVATDLDGTLLDRRGGVSPRTREVLDALDERGVLVVFVTGRPIRWIDHLHEHVGDHGLAVVSNGGAILDVHSGSVVDHRPIPRETGLAVADRLRRELPGTTFSVERLDGFGREHDYVTPAGDRDNADVLVGSLDEVYSDAVVKLLARHPAHPPEEYWQRVEAAAGALVTTTWSSHGPLVEMSARGVTKGSVLRDLCTQRGIASSEVLAFGDMPNDIQMLRWAGTSYAMANAHPRVLAAAQHVAPDQDEDGVARVLESVFGL